MVKAHTRALGTLVVSRTPRGRRAGAPTLIIIWAATISLSLAVTALAALAAPTGQSYPGSPKSIELNEKGAKAIKSGNMKEAEELFHQAVAEDPKNLTAAFNLAGMYLNNKKIDESIKLLEAYTKNYDMDAGLFVRLGDSYFADKKIKEAIGAYKKGYALEPKYPGLPSKLGTVYALANMLAEAEKMFGTAVEQAPKDPQALANLGSLLLANGKHQEAITMAKRALQARPSKEVYVTLATAYELAKDYKNSLIAFQRAADMGDNRQEIKDKIEELKKLSF